MAITMGTENKRQVRLLAALFGGIVLIAGWEIHGAMSTPSATVRMPALASVNAQEHSPARKSSRSRLDPVLRLGELARSEQVEYGATGRNVFAPALTPVAVEAPIAPARPLDAAQLTAAPEKPKPPAMDLKYLGYAQGKDKVYSALFLHGSDMFVAKSGDIMFHRFKVGSIQPASVQVTDLSYNNTQTIPAAN